MKLNNDLPALAGTVQGVVVHTAKPKSGRNSFNKPLVLGGALTILKTAYMLLETCPSGYCIEKDTENEFDNDVLQKKKKQILSYEL